MISMEDIILIGFKTGELHLFQYSDVFNLGSEEQVSINQMIEIIEDIAQYKVQKNYQLDKPKGVRGRSSDNTFTSSKIGWKPKYSLKQGLEKTFAWIYDEIASGANIKKFGRK
jgi:nucleoside-diphosphate-sugar epimerase